MILIGILTNMISLDIFSHLPHIFFKCSKELRFIIRKEALHRANVL